MYRPLLRALPRSTPSLLTPSTLRSVSSIVKPTTPRLDSPKQVKIGGAPLRIGIQDRSSLHPGGIGSNTIAREQAVGTGKFLEGIPKEALIYGGAGLLPYAATSLGSVWLARNTGMSQLGLETLMSMKNSVGLLYHLEILQVQYGAIILSFLGALHWGFEFAGYAGSKRHARYLIGIAPVMLAWGSLLVGGQVALVTQLVGFLGMWVVDMKATKHGWMPPWYSNYRSMLTGVVGSSIVITLAGTAYFGPTKEEKVIPPPKTETTRVV